MLTITNTIVTREQVWAAFRRTHEVRLRERYHAILLLMDVRAVPRWPSGSIGMRRRFAPGSMRLTRQGFQAWSMPRFRGAQRDSQPSNGLRSQTRSAAARESRAIT